MAVSRSRTRGGMVDISLLGDVELSRRLRQLPLTVQKKITRKVLRDAAKIFQRGAKANVPVKSGALQKSIKVRAIKQRKGFFGVQAITGQGFFVGPTFYGAFLEFGTGHTRARELAGGTRARRDTGARIPPYEYMKGAYEELEAEALSKVKQRMGQLLDEALR